MVANLLAVVSILTFRRPKSNKRAQRRTKLVVTAFAREFSHAKISLGRLLLAGNFPLIVAGCASLAALVARQKTCASSPRLSSAVTCNFDSAVFFEVTFAIQNAMQRLLK